MSNSRRSTSSSSFSKSSHSTSSTRTALAVLNSPPKANLNWDELEIINPAYIGELQKRIQNVFPEPIQGYLIYPEEDVQAMIKLKYDPERAAVQKYNPLQLPLAVRLSTNGNFFREKSIVSTKDTLGQTDVIEHKEAVIRYLEFMRQYNLAYIDYLNAINGSGAAAKAFVEKFKTFKMFENAKINRKVFDNSFYPTPEFLFGTLAYLTLHILFSQDQEISTVARVRALEIIVNNFDLDLLGKAFRVYANTDYNLNSMFSVKPAVYNLIPKAFVTKAEETGTVDQSDLFFKNVTIAKIFKINPRYNRLEQCNLDSATSELITHYKTQALHILHSALRCIAKDEVVFPYLFAIIFKLSKLDNAQKQAIFGDDASYRNGGIDIRNATAPIDWVMGLDSFGSYLDEAQLEQLDKPQLIQRIRQDAYRIYQLQAAAMNSEREQALNSLNQRNDPKNYLQLLLMPADPLTDDEFDEKLKRNYRVLAREQHPDGQSGRGSVELFQRLQEAYAELSDRQRRHAYMGQGDVEELRSRDVLMQR